MPYRVIGDRITFDFTTHDPLSGQVSDADVLPTCAVFEDDTDVPILTPVVTKRAGLTGDYRVSFDATAANGFEVGKSYNVVATAIVSAIEAKARIGAFRLGTTVVPQAHFIL
jgi:hypothetical protein